MAGNTERVSFTKASADRIAKVVRRVESGNRDGAPFVGAPRDIGSSNSSGKLREGTFSGDWDIGTYKNVTLCSTTLTVLVKNLTMNWRGDGASPGTVLFSRACGTHVATEISVDQQRNIGGSVAKIASFAAPEIQVLGHDTAGILKWYSVITCSTASTP